jgi:hypothetical protein
LAELAPQHIAKAKEAVREAFPEMAGVEPRVSVKAAHSKGKGSGNAIYVLTFKKGISLQDGGCLTRAVRVTMDQTGEIIKLTSSK